MLDIDTIDQILKVLTDKLDEIENRLNELANRK